MTSARYPDVITVAVWGDHISFVRRYGRSDGTFGTMTGTALALWRAWEAEECPFGVLVDRLEEMPEEVVGIAPADVLLCVEWLRAHSGGW